MRQRGHLLGALLLQLPLALQAVGKLLAHSLQGLQRGRKFPDARVVYVNSFGVLGGDLARRLVDAGGLCRKGTHGTVGGYGQPRQHQNDQQDNVTGLKIRQAFPQGRVGIGQGVVVLQKAGGAVSHGDDVLILHHPQVAAAAVQGVEGSLQLAGRHVGGVYGLPCRVGIGDYGVAAKGADGGGVKGICGHGGNGLPCFGAGLGGGHRRQQKANVNQLHKNDPPKDQNQRTSPAAQAEVAQQHAAQRSQASAAFHKYPTPHTVFSTVSGLASPAARSLARMFLMCWVMAVSSAVPS